MGGEAGPGQGGRGRVIPIPTGTAGPPRSQGSPGGVGKPGVSSLKDAQEGRVVHQAAQTSRNFPGGPVVKTQSFHCGVTGLVPGWGTRILHATWHGQKIKNKKIIDCPNPKCVGDNSVW